MSYKRYGLGGLLALALMAEAGTASANGRYPAANDIVFNRSDPNQLLVRTTYGFVQTKDRGNTWRWFCEGALGIGFIAYDPPLTLTADGTAIIAAGSFNGVATSRDGCSWTPSPPIMAGQLVTDMTWIPNNSAGALVLISTHEPSINGWINKIVETADNGRTWSQKGAAIPSDVFTTTLEVAPSNSSRIYVSALRYIASTDTRVGVFFRSENGGASWTRSEMPLPTDDNGLYIAGIDPNNPDRIYLRVAYGLRSPGPNPGDPDVVTPATVLRISDDKGMTWRDVYNTEQESGEDRAMLGFAVSPDGTRIVLGGLFGVLAGPAPAGPFAPVSNIQNRCLKWTSAGIYACGTQNNFQPSDPFTIGLSTDGGRTFESIYERVSQTCPLQCDAGTATGSVCPIVWYNPTEPNIYKNIKPLIGARADCGSTPGGCVPATIAPASTSSSVRFAVPAGAVAIGGVFFALWWRRRRAAAN